MESFLKTKKVRTVFWVIGGLAVLLLVFALGMAVGYGRAMFNGNFAANYYRNFGPGGGFFAGAAPAGMHGIVGAVIDVATSSFLVKDSDNDEKSVAVLQNTSIRKMDKTIEAESIMVGDEVTVIGWPNAAGQIQAQFIRVFTTSSSAPEATNFE